MCDDMSSRAHHGNTWWVIARRADGRQAISIAFVEVKNINGDVRSNRPLIGCVKCRR